MADENDGWEIGGYKYDSGRSNWDPDYGNNSQCFPYSTRIETPRGKIQIGDICPGQTVWSFRNGTMIERPVTKKLNYGLSRIMEINFGRDESSLRCAKVHSFLTDKGYVSLLKLNPGDRIVYINEFGETLRCITNINKTDAVEPVFNIYTQGEHNFIVDGYVAHNFTRFRTLRTFLHRVVFDNRCNFLPEKLA